MPRNTPYNPSLPPLSPTTARAAYLAAGQDATTTSPTPMTSPPPPVSSHTTNEIDITPLTNDTLPVTPHQIATKRALTAKQRLATAHEGWALVAQHLVKAGIIPADQGIATEMSAFGEAICGRYAAASFLWRVLGDMKEGEWFGRGLTSGREREKGVDVTMRRLKTLKGLEGSLRCWEGVVLKLVGLVDGGDIGEDKKGEVGRFLGRWRRGVPSRP